MIGSLSGTLRGGVQESAEEPHCLVPHEQPAAQHLKDQGTGHRLWEGQTKDETLIEGKEVEVVETHKYLGLWLDNKLDWASNTIQLYKNAQSRLYFLRRHDPLTSAGSSCGCFTSL